MSLPHFPSCEDDVNKGALFRWGLRVEEWKKEHEKLYVCVSIEELQKLDVSKEIKDFKSTLARSPNFVVGFERGVEWLKNRILEEKKKSLLEVGK